MVANFYSDEKEWQWLFKNGMDWEKILPLYYPQYPTSEGLENKIEVIQFLEELLQQTGNWAASIQNDGTAKELDENGIGEVKDGETRTGPVMQKIYNQAKELGIYGLPLPKKYGGLEAPASIHMFLLGQLGRACVSTCTQLGFFTSIGEMIYRFGEEEDKNRLIPKIVAGDLSGSMCLTESGCGSDLSKIKTSATLNEDGSYSLNGSKIFITNGGGGIGLVLARIKDSPEGLEGLSIFLVEQKIPGKNSLNFYITKNEEKMGMHGSFTNQVIYENSKGKLIGKKNEGLKIMLHLMNEARIAVGMQSLGLIEASLDYAIKYADEREAFGRPISKLPLMKRNIQDFETERDALRALLVDTVSWFDIFTKLDHKKLDTGDLSKDDMKNYSEARIWVRKRTPLVKYYATELSTTITTKAIQILGGYGFMKEYPLERFHRDSFGPLLYEGTSQIQALMALKDLVKYAMQDPKSFFTNIIEKHPGTEFLGGEEWERAHKGTHYQFKKKMCGLFIKCLRPKNPKKIFHLKSWTDQEGLETLMAHAETLCQGLSYIETLRVLADHANKNSERADLFFRYHKLILPRLEAIYTDWSLR